MWLEACVAVMVAVRRAAGRWCGEARRPSGAGFAFVRRAPADRAGTFGILQPHHGSGVGALQPITVRGRSWLVTHCSAKSLELWTSAAGDRRRNYCSQSVRATTRVLTDMTACDMTRKKQPRVR